MSEFTLEINTDNSAFCTQLEDGTDTDDINARNAEVARILRYAAERVELNTWGPLRDVNGNTVGRYEHTDDEPARS